MKVELFRETYPEDPEQLFKEAHLKAGIAHWLKSTEPGKFVAEHGNGVKVTSYRNPDSMTYDLILSTEFANDAHATMYLLIKPTKL